MRSARPWIVFRGVVAAVAFGAAGAALAQQVPAGPPPAPITPMMSSPTLLPSVCTPGAPNGGALCPMAPPLSTVPPIAPVPMAPPLPPSSPAAALAGGSSSSVSEIGDDKVLSYFQRSVTYVDTSKAFGFVLMPRSAVTAEEKAVQARFCRIMLASLEFMAPDAAVQRKALITYWPLSGAVDREQIEAAFEERDCAQLILWYDHNLARSVAARAGVSGLSGPLLITWPSEVAGREARDPLIVDFAKADHAHATKALQYWFEQLRNKPELWTSRMREGTIRAELADAINDTAGVVVAVLAGKWESVTAVSDTP